ncbi:MAG: bifunctional oligoribonuclease/PAP phosphatase NrnA [Bacteroidetes bacterium]|nr:bifunctional oligoribonuclease/PAP phosphatase NrnA [Bacteroidota bacterium]
MKNNSFKEIAGALKQHHRILITTHTNPDGDAIGSSLALYGYLKRKGYDVHVMAPDPDPTFLHWMPFHEHLLCFTQDREKCIRLIDEADLIFSIDYNDLGRLEEATGYVRRSNGMKVLIDHHVQPGPEFNLKVSIKEVSSTAELIYDFILESGGNEFIDKDIAACIYAGIITDTGSFSYSCNYPKTYEIAAHLISSGIDGEHIHRLVYDTYSEDRLRLLGFSLSDKLVVLPGSNTAFISLSKAELEKFHHEVGDTEGVVNYALSIKDINLAALFMEREGVIKISFRSKGNFSVNELSRKHFNGGGHRNAAGAYSYISLQETIDKFVRLLPDYSEALKIVY